MGAAKCYSISQLAAEFGLTRRTIRFYQDGKLPIPPLTVLSVEGWHAMYETASNDDTGPAPAMIVIRDWIMTIKVSGQ